MGCVHGTDAVANCEFYLWMCYLYDVEPKRSATSIWPGVCASRPGSNRMYAFEHVIHWKISVRSLDSTRPSASIRSHKLWIKLFINCTMPHQYDSVCYDSYSRYAQARLPFDYPRYPHEVPRRGAYSFYSNFLPHQIEVSGHAFFLCQCVCLSVHLAF